MLKLSHDTTIKGDAERAQYTDTEHQAVEQYKRRLTASKTEDPTAPVSPIEIAKNQLISVIAVHGKVIQELQRRLDPVLCGAGSGQQNESKKDVPSTGSVICRFMRDAAEEIDSQNDILRNILATLDL